MTLFKDFSARSHVNLVPSHKTGSHFEAAINCMIIHAYKISFLNQKYMLRFISYLVKESVNDISYIILMSKRFVQFALYDADILCKND